MRVEFAYAQARAQAQHGRRLSAETWSLLESSVGLAQFLHHVRGTALAPKVEHFAATTSPHVIERSLRREWHEQVDCATRWAPQRWRPAVAWTSRLAELPATRHLETGGELRAWMSGDPALSTIAVEDPRERQVSIDAAAGSGLESWLRRWRQLWPEEAGSHAALEALLSLVERHAVRDAGDAAVDRRSTLERHAVRILRGRREQPVTVFCHLLLCALELHRLRQGLVQRALFNDVDAEFAA